MAARPLPAAIAQEIRDIRRSSKTFSVDFDKTTREATFTSGGITIVGTIPPGWEIDEISDSFIDEVLQRGRND